MSHQGTINEAQRDAIRELIPQPPPHNTWKEIVAALVAFSIIGVFVIFMFITLRCVLYEPECDHGIEVLHLIAHIFSPLIGAIVAFYFTHLIILRS
jgi:hypothetical protein